MITDWKHVSSLTEPPDAYGEVPYNAHLTVNLYSKPTEEWLEVLPSEEFDQLPFWLKEEVSQTGWGWLLGYDDYSIWEPDAFPRVVQWLLEHGIAPDQPFAVCLSPSRITGPDLFGDYDSEPVDYEISWIEPWSPEHTAAKWEALLEWVRQRDAESANSDGMS